MDIPGVVASRLYSATLTATKSLRIGKCVVSAWSLQLLTMVTVAATAIIPRASMFIIVLSFAGQRYILACSVID
ncbi:hypothetical protein A5714_12270 [Mycobacterium sp. E2462]|nr:hypothetical protein A5714_12270 [Mycobacterium sp. E2462]